MTLATITPRLRVQLSLTHVEPDSVPLAGGFVLAPSNYLQDDVSVENVVRLFETAREFGKYPIHM